MRKSYLRACASLSSIAIASAVALPAVAQTAPADESQGYLDEIVVTATTGDKTKLDSAISVTSVDSGVLQDFRPTSESEVFRLIPGIQVNGTAGPGGNANIAVRGLPVATGGSPFVQIQEDGLPTVLFGDIQFGNNDYWTKFDASVERIEAVRGGSATTFASQAPGAVINYISNTGDEEGGYIQLGKGLNFKETKIDFRYGGPINDTLRFHVGGFFKTGQGPLNADYKVSDSVQIKGNVTKDFADDKGYLRFLFKFADTQEPNYTGSPALANINGLDVNNVRAFPGFDGRKQSAYSINNQNFVILNRDGVLERVDMDGITTQQVSLGGQFHYNVSDAIRVDNNFRWSDINGGFASPFTNFVRTSSVLGSPLTLNGVAYTAPATQLRYANGPKAGQVYTATYVDNNVNVRTNIRDLGSLSNDLAVTGKFESGLGAVTARVGYFYMSQDIAMDWHVNKSLREVSGDNPAQLDLYTAAGARLTYEGISGYNNNWGDCCARDYDLNYTNQAPYIGLDLDADRFALDGSVRFDRVDASGYAIGGGREFLVSSGGVNLPAITSNGTRENLNYSRSYTSWTGGALFKASKNLSLFGRASRGARFNGDRQTLSGKITADGRLNAAGDAAAVDFVKQYELGLKAQGDIGIGSFTTEITLLKGNFKQSTFELSATRCPGGAGGCIIDARYKSKGVEFFGTFNSGGFSLVSTATYSDAKRSGVDGSGNPTPFTKAPYLPSLIYSVSANYDVNKLVSVGLSTTGQTSIVDDAGRKYPGKPVFNGVVKAYPIGDLEVALQVYNLFNTFDARGSGGVADLSVTPSVIGVTPAIGRTLTASIRYSF